MGLTKRILTVMQVCFLSVGFTLGQFAVPTGDAWAASKKAERCWQREMRAGTLGAACATAIAFAKTSCIAAGALVPFDFGATAIFCAASLSAVAVACGVTVSAVTKAVKACW